MIRDGVGVARPWPSAPVGAGSRRNLSRADAVRYALNAVRKVDPFLLALTLFACDARGEAETPPRHLPDAADEATPARVPREHEAPTREADATPPSEPDDAGPPSEPDEQALEAEPILDATSLEPVPPADYGLIKPSDPPPDPTALTVHALAGYEVVAIYDKPDTSATRLGYLRIGQRLKVTPKREGVGCKAGFHQLPQGGYACASKGLVVDPVRPPYMHAPPSPPRDEALPYDYAFVHKWNSPMWWRIPTAAELTYAGVKRAELEAARKAADEAAAATGPVAAASKPASPARELSPPPGSPAQVQNEVVPASTLPSVVDPFDGEGEAATPDAAPSNVAPPPRDSRAATPAPTPAPEPVPEVALPLNPQHPWLERGFFVSLAEKMNEGGQVWWRTARGGYVSGSDAYTYTPKDFQGVELSEGTAFPFGFVMTKDGTKLYEQDASGKLRAVGTLERRTFVDLTEATEIGGREYMITAEGKLVRSADIRFADPQPVPEGLAPWERWIDVSIEKQMLVAYRGETPVFVTLVSTGRKGTTEEPFDTPTGRFRIRSKHISSNMDGNTASDGNYSIQDVPWAMFFEGSYALHGAFWHEGFGRVRSHGCVNLGPTDARWLFYWTTPALPEGWHGVNAHAGSPGTTIVVRP